MKLEKLEDNTSKVKGVIIGILLTIGLVILINYITSLARYRNTESIELASGNISYNKADLNIIAMYQEKDDSTSEEKEYINISKIPTMGYKLSEDSYCEVNGKPIEEVEIEYVNSEINISHLTEKGTKCYIYFDSLVKEMLGKLETSKGSKYTIDAMPNPITGPYDESTENPEGKEKLYTSPDNYGTSYVFRGNNDDVNNWVTFANHTWRIIRINGDGTLRLIFQCAEPNCETTEGETTNATTSAYKSAPYDDNTYIGYYYGTAKSEEYPNPKYEEAHSNTTPSNIAEAVQTWYNGIGSMSGYTDYLEGSTGWCNDRTVVKNVFNGYNGDGTGETATGYAPISRLMTTDRWRKNQYSTLKCGVKMSETSPSDVEGFKSFDEIDLNSLKRDLFTTIGSNVGNQSLDVPAALITSDEVMMVGGFGGTASTDYWLYTNQYYWTMSPSRYNVTGKLVHVFRVLNGGDLNGFAVYGNHGVRPVINLKSNIEFSGGNGKSGSPFVVKTNI